MKKSNSKNNDKRNKKRNSPSISLGKVFDKHVKSEFEDKDLESTMKMMVKEPYVYHVPVMTGGVGYDNVYSFYKNDFIGKCLKTSSLRVSPAPLERTRLSMN